MHAGENMKRIACIAHWPHQLTAASASRQSPVSQAPARALLLQNQILPHLSLNFAKTSSTTATTTTVTKTTMTKATILAQVTE